jgi:hypothetical protein
VVKGCQRPSRTWGNTVEQTARLRGGLAEVKSEGKCQFAWSAQRPRHEPQSAARDFSLKRPDGPRFGSSMARLGGAMVSSLPERQHDGVA